MRRFSLAGLLALVLVSTVVLQNGASYNLDTVKERVVSPFKRVSKWVKAESQSVKENLYEHTHLTEAQKDAVEDSVSKIAMLAEQLKEEEARIDNLHLQRKALAWEHPMWMFDKELSRKHRQLTFELKSDDRHLVSLQEEVHMHMEDIKAVVGIYSWLFLVDLGLVVMTPLIDTFQFILNTVYSSLLLFAFVFVPVLFAMLLFFLELRRAIVPLYLIVHCGMVALELPGMVLKYNPQPWEFALILIPSVQFLVFLASRFVPTPSKGGSSKIKSD